MAPVRVRKDSKAPAKKPAKTYTPEMLVEQGNIALNNCELELAATFFERALSMSPTDTNIMDSLAIICVQMGDTEKALELLLTSTKQAPNANAYKWCYLGQLRCGMEAVSCYRTVIQLLTVQLATETQNANNIPAPDVEAHAAAVQALSGISKEIAKAHCSIVELYLSDLCDEPDAETTCEAEVAAALAAFPASLDAQQTLASLRLSQNYREDRNYKLEAGEIMQKVCAEILRVRRIIEARTLIDDAAGAPLPAECQDAPEMGFCLATMKLAIECATEPAYASLYQSAQELGQSLLDEDDSLIELRYLLGIAFMGGMDCNSNQSADAASTADAAAAAATKGGKKGSKKTASAATAVTDSGDAAQRNAAAAAMADLGAAQYHFEEARAMMDAIRKQQREEGVLDMGREFEEQYGLLAEHLRILAAISGAHPELQQQGQGQQGPGSGGAALVDEEWSDEEEGMDVEN